MTPNQIGSDMNYYETFIRVAPDCPVNAGSVPAPRGANKTVPVLEYELLSDNLYGYTQEELLFTVYAERLGLPADELASRRGELWAEFFLQIPGLSARLFPAQTLWLGPAFRQGRQDRTLPRGERRVSAPSRR